MKFKIKEYENRSDIVMVTNLSDTVYKHSDFTIEPNQTVELKKGIAKVRLGDWDDLNKAEEKERRKHLNILHFEFIMEDKEVFQTIKQVVHQLTDITDEEEFPALKELKQQQQEVIVDNEGKKPRKNAKKGE